MYCLICDIICLFYCNNVCDCIFFDLQMRLQLLEVDLVQERVQSSSVMLGAWERKRISYSVKIRV